MSASGVSAVRVYRSGGDDGVPDLIMDAFGIGYLRYGSAARGLIKTFWMSADISVNTYDGVDRLIASTETDYADTSTTTITSTSTVGYINQGSQVLLTLDMTAGSSSVGQVLQNYFLGSQPGEILAVDVAGTTTSTVWLYTDLTGAVVSLGTMDSSAGTWAIQQRQVGSTGTVISTVGDTGGALSQVPVIWKGVIQQPQATGALYELNGRWFDPSQNRFLSEGLVTAATPNPYTLNGNDPIDANVAWSTTQRPMPGGYLHELKNPGNMDTDLQRMFWGGIIVSLVSGAGAIARGFATGGAVTLSGMGSASLATVSYVSLGVSATRVYRSGGNDGVPDLIMDAFGIGYLHGARHTWALFPAPC